MMLLKQSTTINVKVGPFVDSADGYTAKTALSPTVKVSKNGAALAARNSATAIAHDADGWYTVELDTTDTGTLGRLTLSVVGSSSSLPVWHEYMVLPANVYDGLVAGSDVLQVDVSQWNNSNIASPDTAGYPKVTVKSGTGTGEVSLSSGKVSPANASITSSTFAAGAIDAAAIAPDAIGASELGADAVAEIAAAVAAPSAATIVSTLLGSTNTSNNDPTQVGGQIRRTHALAGGTKNTQDASATNAPIKARNEADSSNLVTVTPTESAGVTTWTPT